MTLKREGVIFESEKGVVMQNKFRTAGFSLIEIAIVVVILGIVAMFAFPALFSQIEKHRGQEALQAMNLIKSNIESCGIQNAYSFTNCYSWDGIGMGDPSNSAGNTGSNFNYAIADIAAAGDGYVITATRTTSTDTITISRSSSGVSTCAGTGAFQGLC